MYQLKDDVGISSHFSLRAHRSHSPCARDSPHSDTSLSPRRSAVPSSLSQNIWERRECRSSRCWKHLTYQMWMPFMKKVLCALADRVIWGRMRSRMRAELLKWKEKKRRVSERWMWRTSKTERRKADRKSRNHFPTNKQQQLSHHLGCWERRVGAFAQRSRVKWKRSKNYHLTVWSDFRLISVTKEFISNNRLIKVECNFKLLALLIFTLISFRRTLEISRSSHHNIFFHPNSPSTTLTGSAHYSALWSLRLRSAVDMGWRQFPMSKRIRWKQKKESFKLH